MKFGAPFASGYGDHNNHIALLEVKKRNNTSLSVRFWPAPGFGNSWFGVYLNNVWQLAIYANENQWTKSLRVPLGRTSGKRLVTVLRHGNSSDIEMERIARCMDTTSSRTRIAWPWEPEIICSTDTYLTGWDVDGITYAALEAVPAKRTRRTLTVNAVVTGSDIDIEVKKNSTVVMSGSGTVGTTVSLSEQNSSGMSGEVDVDAGAESFSDGKLWVRWPEKMVVKRSVSDPPSAVVDTVLFDATDSYTWTDPADLAANTYYYRLQPVSDTDDLGDESPSSLEAVIPGAPQPPTDVAYDSGDASATTIVWDAPPAVQSYKVYLKTPDDDFFDFNAPVATPSAETEWAVLPALPYAGKSYVIVHAVLGGIEEKNGEMLELEYDDNGDFVPKRPNTPSLVEGTVRVTAGLQLSVNGVYTSPNEAATPTKLQLFARMPGATYDFETPLAESALTANDQRGVRTATLQYTFLSDGCYYVTAKAATAAGTQSEGYANELFIYVSAANVPAPTGVTLEVTRGL